MSVGRSLDTELAFFAIDRRLSSSLNSLPPVVVTIMGHGKTTLLEVIHKPNAAWKETTAVRPHIAAYTISIPHPKQPQQVRQITFLDTPGDPDSRAMRAFGAQVSDIVVLVVAADEGVMPQTLEAIGHAQTARVPVIVAVNKCDHISNVTKHGIDTLLEAILAHADLRNLKFNPESPVKGNVIDSCLDPGGPTITVLVREGTLRVGNILQCGEFCGPVTALIDTDGTYQSEAGPATVVKVLGLNGAPEVGLEFSVRGTQQTAHEEAAKARANIH
jgi:translation initiation factor IF-2